MRRRSHRKILDDVRFGFSIRRADCVAMERGFLLGSRAERSLEKMNQKNEKSLVINQQTQEIMQKGDASAFKIEEVNLDGGKFTKISSTSEEGMTVEINQNGYSILTN